MKYIKTGTIQNLLAQADEDNRPLYITGPIGCGKTAAIEYFYRRISHWTIDCADGKIEQKIIPSKIRPRVVIFDNVSYLEEESSRKYVLDMLTRSDKHIIFTSRAPRPSWLISKSMDENVLLADHRDFRLSKEQVFRLMEELGVDASEEEMLKVMEDARSNPLVISCIAYYMKDTGVYSKEVNTFARINYHTYLDNELLGRMSPQEAEFLLAMSWYPSFSFDLARELNNGLDCRPVVDSIQKKNAYILTFSSIGVQLMDSYIDYLRHKRSIFWSDEKHRDNLCRAAEYYERTGNLRTALQCYQNAHADDRYFQLLEKTAREGVNVASVSSLMDYYETLDPDKVRTSWPLVSALAMTESLMIRPKKAEYWFVYLKKMYENEKDQQVRDDIHRRILFLDVMMPHHGNKNIEKRFGRLNDEFFRDPNGMPKEYIDMTPTIIHGSIDFCELSKDEGKLISVCSKIIEALKGRASKAVLDIVKAELAYERDELDDFEIHRLLERGYMIADSDESYAACFAAVGVSVHLHLFRGNLVRAEELLDSVRKKAVDAKNDTLLRNIDALYSWVDQLHSNRESVSAWLETATDEGIGFTFLERSIMICKVRAYMIMGRLDCALDLIERLLVFFEMYDRTYAYYETLLYKAICYYRIKKPEYEQIMSEVMEKAYELGFYHLIADHGIAALELVENVKPASVSRTFYNHLLKMTKQMAENYPNYLQCVDELKEPLTKTERRVLHLLCEGLNADEICKMMDISYSGIKFHNKNIYRKLGAANRNEAVRRAIMLGITSVGLLDS